MMHSSDRHPFTRESCESLYRPLSLVLLALVAGFGVGCDTSENPDLINPTLADSTATRVLNLSEVNLTQVSLGGATIGEDVPPGFTSSASPVWLINRTNLIIRSQARVDTVRNVKPATSVEDPLLVTWIVFPSADSLVAAQVVTGTAETEFLRSSEEGRIYFFNAVGDRSLLLREGCTSGRVAFPETPAHSLAGSGTFESGTYSFYLFAESDEVASAQVDLTSGEIIALVARPDGSGGVRLESIDLGVGTGQSPLPLTQLPPEDRTEGELTIINGLMDREIEVRTVGTAEIITTSLPPGQASQSARLELCQTPEGDSLTIMTSDQDTVTVPFNADVGSSTRIVVFDDGTEIRALVLTPPEKELPQSVQLRAVNLGSPATTLSLVVGAGAPGRLNKGSLLFSSLRTGTLTGYRELESGLYPLGLEFSSSGFFIAGGLERLNPGRYTILALESATGPILRILNESSGETELRELSVSGERSILFSGIPESVVSFRIASSVGELTISDVAYSYVYPTILPRENVSVEVGGVSSTVEIGTSGSILGWTGDGAGSGGLLSINRLNVRPDPGKSALRFLSGIPGAGSLAARTDSALGPVVTTFAYPDPSQTLIQDARRHTFVITPEGQNELLARVNSIQLSEERSYVLVVVPAGVTNTSGLKYATIFLQE